MRHLVTQYAVAQLIALAIILVLALIYDNWHEEKVRRRSRGPWKD